MIGEKVKQKRRKIRTNETNVPQRLYQHLSRAFSSFVDGSTAGPLNNDIPTAVRNTGTITQMSPDSQVRDPMSDEDNGLLTSALTVPGGQAHTANNPQRSQKGNDLSTIEKQFSYILDENGNLKNRKNTNAAAAIIMKKGIHYAASWESLLTFLCVTGRTRFSRDLYSILREAVQTVSKDEVSLLSYSSAREKQTSYFNDYCFPKSNIFHIPITNLPSEHSKKLSSIKTASGDKKDVRECVKVVLPSAWARYDISSYPSYSDVIEGKHHVEKSEISIEHTAVVNDREFHTGTTSSFWATYKHLYVNVNIGTLISVKLSFDNLTSEWKRTFDLIDDEQGNYFVECVTGPQWCVSPPNHVSSRSVPVSMEHLSADEKILYENFKISNASLDEAWSSWAELNTDSETPAKKKPRTSCRRFSAGNFNKSPSSHNVNESTVKLYPSDIVTILRPKETRRNSRVVCIFLSSFVSNVTGSDSERVLWVDIDKLTTAVERNADVSEISPPIHTNIPVILNSVVIDIPNVHSDNKTPIQFLNNRRSNIKGTMKDGRSYVIYRFALYADEFGFDGVCGCYMLLLGAAQHNRISSAGVRALTLVPKCQDVNKVLKIILDDVVKGTLYGIEGIDPYGNQVLIFLDMLSFYADYVKLAAVTNCAGHSATCFCPLCKIKKNASNIGPTYGYSEKNHCRRLGFMKCDEILSILTSSDISSTYRTSLGLRTVDSAEADDIPLVYFSNRLSQQTRSDLPVAANGDLIVTPFFDSSLSTAVAPDHLLSGLATVLLTACFKSIPDDSNRKKVEVAILKSAALNDLPTEGSFLSYKQGRFVGLSSMSMSTTYIILLFGSRIFKDLDNTQLNTKKLFHIPLLLQNIIAHLYHWPELFIDPSTEVTKVQSENGRSYLIDLRNMTESYSKAVSQHMNTYGDNAVLKDRPNSHRLFELVVHTIPLFGHGKIVSELVLELTHAFFKSWFKQNTHSSSHFTAVDLFVTRIWASHVLVLYHMWKHGEQNMREVAFCNLLRSFFGDVGTFISLHPDKISTEVEKLLEVFETNLNNIMKPPVPRLLLGNIPITLMYEKSEWVCSKMKTDMKTFDKITDEGIEIIANELEVDYVKCKEEIRFFEKASNTVIGKHGTGTRTYPYKTLYRGVSATLLVSAAEIERPFFNGDAIRSSTRLCFVVHDIVKKGSTPYIIGKLIQVSKNNTFYGISADDAQVKVIQLTNNVLRIGSHHVYDSQSHASSSSISTHSSTVNQTRPQRNHLYFRSGGYPPCLG